MCEVHIDPVSLVRRNTDIIHLLEYNKNVIPKFNYIFIYGQKSGVHRKVNPAGKAIGGKAIKTPGWLTLAVTLNFDLLLLYLLHKK